MNFKKALLTTLTTIMVGGVVLSANQNTSQFEPQAANPETKRIWAISRVSYWFADSAIFSVATKKSDGSAYTTYTMTRDENNNNTSDGFTGNQTYAYFVDVPTDASQVEFFRQVVANRYNYSGWTSYSSGMIYVYDENDVIGLSTDTNYSFLTTKVVSDYAAELDTSAEVCT